MPPILAEDTSALWLLTLQRVIGRASHDVKDALNGVSVNLEVIRSRSLRPDVSVSALTPFNDAAGLQLDRLTNLIEAVLALSRPERSPADVGLTLRRVATLCGVSGLPGDAPVRMQDDGSVGPTLTRVRGDVVRLALTAPLLEIVTRNDRLHRASEVTCSLTGDEESVLVDITATDRRATMPESVAEVVRSGGVRWIEGERNLSLAFPRV